MSSNWTPKPLGHFLDRVVGGGTPSRKVKEHWEGNIPWASVKDFQEDILLLHNTAEHISSEGLEKSAANLIPAGVPLICVRMAVGRAALTTQSTAINQDVKALYTNDLLLPEYLLYLLRFHRQQLEAVAIGSTVKGIRLKQLLSLPIKVPSLPIQRLIITMLDAIDEQIQHTEQIIAKLRLQREGLLHKLLTCGIDEHGQLRAHSASYRASQKIELESFPKEWAIHPLGEIAEVASGLTLGRKFSGADTIELPYLRVANVQDGYLDLRDMKTMRIPTDDLPKYLLQPGDVLMTEGGDFDKLGRGTVWNGQISPCLHQNHIFRVRPDKHLLLPEFLTMISSSSYGKRFLLLSSKQSTNLASINSTQLKSFPIPCPSIAEQEQILDVISKYDKSTNIEEMQRNKLKQYKTGLMHDLLTGKVRVGEKQGKGAH